MNQQKKIKRLENRIVYLEGKEFYDCIKKLVLKEEQTKRGKE